VSLACEDHAANSRETSSMPAYGLIGAEPDDSDPDYVNLQSSVWNAVRRRTDPLPIDGAGFERSTALSPDVYPAAWLVIDNVGTPSPN